MRKLIHRKETLYIEKLLYNPWNQRNWEKLKDSVFFKVHRLIRLYDKYQPLKKPYFLSAIIA